ncbi:MAG: hypothetical protein J7M09_04375, partial [Deltaproteobacteria bacterium]|nr:hypothetical protein [Candidatus Tharpella sp.]
RYSNTDDPFLYMQRLVRCNSSPLSGDNSRESGAEFWFEKEIIDYKTSFTETLMMGLRLRQGVGLAGLRAEYGSHLVDAVMFQAQRLQIEGLVDWDENNLWITDKGLFLSDTIITSLL